MKKRTECYVCSPVELELVCPKCQKTNITWSEFEEHIWCYDCKDDIKYEKGGAGPIPIQTAVLMGIDYRKYNLKTGKIVPGEINKYYEKTP
jgi:ribosomal protein S27E